MREWGGRQAQHSCWTSSRVPYGTACTLYRAHTVLRSREIRSLHFYLRISHGSFLPRLLPRCDMAAWNATGRAAGNRHLLGFDLVGWLARLACLDIEY